MSGQRNKKPDDIIKKRQEYLDNLNLEISLQDNNEQAVTNYKQTGQLPPITQMKDNRTVEQKLRDYEKLKQSIRDDLAPIASPQLANLIIQKIQDSPFNQDNGLLVFLAQRAPDFVKNLEKSYKFGIKGDDNDASQFVSFIVKYYNDKNSIVSNTKEFMTRLGANSQKSLIQKADQQSQILNKLEAEINRVIIDLERNLKNTPQLIQFKDYLKKQRMLFTRFIDVIKSIYPSDLLYGTVRDENGNIVKITLEFLEKEFNYIMTQYAFTPDQMKISDDYLLFLNYINHNIPNTDYVNTLLTSLIKRCEILKSSSNTVNIQNVKEALDNLFEIINTGENIQELINVRDALARIINYYIRAIQGLYRQPAQPAQLAQPAQPAQPTQPAQPVQPEQEGQPAQGNTEERIPADFNDFEQEGEDIMPAQNLLRTGYNFLRGNEEEEGEDIMPAQNLLRTGYNFLRGNATEEDERRRYYERKTFIERIARQRLNEQQMTIFYTTVRRIDNEVNTGRLSYGDASEELKGFSQFYLHLDPSRSGHGIKGSGINPNQLYNFTKQKINPYEGVQEDPRYIKFGRYLVNTKRLKDDVLSLRRQKGTPIASLPAYKMTRPFKNVVNKIIGGALPSSEDFEKLTDDEKRYLHKVSKEADLSHKLEIPTPSKDEDEKDEHLFNVYKGEIMAGNDNKEMVKKFKLLLMKLSRKNYINKNEANDILEMLTNAGY